MRASIIRAVTIIIIFFSTPLPSYSQLSQRVVRTWTAADGRSFEGELKKFDESSISVQRRSDLKTFSLPLEKLSEVDQKFVRNLIGEQKRNLSLKEGPYAESVTSEFVKGQSDAGLLYQFWGGKKFKGEKRYPLVIWLHGAGQSGDDNEAQMGLPTRIFTDEDHQDKNPCFILAPQCPSREQGWRNEVADNLATLITHLADNLPIDRNRIYVTGLSMGGFGSFTMAGSYPQLFAASAPLAGGGNPSMAAAMKTVPLWVFHGDQDTEVMPEKSKVMVDAIKAAGGTVKFDLLKGKGHVISGDVYPRDDFHQWLFAQTKTAVSEPKPDNK